MTGKPKLMQTGDWYRLFCPELTLEDAALSQIVHLPGVRVYHPTAIEFHKSLLQLEVVQHLVKAVPTCRAVSARVPQAVTSLSQFWQPARPLFQHQKDALPFLLNARRSLLADDMGLAKSASAITFAETVMQEYQGRPCIILAKRTLHSNWTRELHLAGAIKNDSDVARIESRDQDHSSFNPNARYFLINPEIVRDWWNKLTRQKPCVTIIDEAHMYKDPKTNRAKGAQMVATAPYCLLLTGTPMPNKPVELWNLLNILHPRAWGSQYDYRIRYCGAERSEYGLKDTVPTHTDELKQRMASFYMRRHANVTGLNLPKLSRKIIVAPWDELKNGKELKDKYDNIFRTIAPGELKRLLVEGRAGKRTLEVLAALRKITSAAKFDTTVDYVRGLREQKESVVIFTWQKETAVKLAKKLKGVFVTGDVKQEERARLCEEFQRSGGVIVATYATIAEGVTLTNARIVVLHDLHWVPADMLQAEKRIDRIGQKRACISVWVMMQNSIDDLFVAALEKKLEAIGSVVTDDNSMHAFVKTAADSEENVDEVEEMLTAWKNAK